MSCRVFILLFILLIGYGTIHAQVQNDSLLVYFHSGSTEFDTSLQNNAKNIDLFCEKIDSLFLSSFCTLSSIYVEGKASPSDSVSLNKRLSEARARCVLQYIRSRVSVPDSLMSARSIGMDWGGLTALVEQDKALPYRNDILRILHHTPIYVYDTQGRIVSGRRKQLMDLEGGRAYRMLKERYFAKLQCTYIHIEYEKVETSRVKEEIPVAEVAPQSQQTGQPLVAQRPLKNEPVAVASASEVAAQANLKAKEPLHQWAVKTNLLYDAVLMPALEVEYRINDRWSVQLEGDMAWWTNDGKHQFYQVATISPEGRYWFKTKRPWHGHYVGLFGGFTWYDLENKKRGYRGEAVLAGFTYGYMFPIGKNLSMEVGLGAGYMHTEYAEYLPIDGCYVYQQTKRMGYFGPLKLRCSLVWRLWDVYKKKGGAR